MKKRANRAGQSSRGSAGGGGSTPGDLDVDQSPAGWKDHEAANDLMTPGSTPSSLLPSGQRKRRGTAGSAGHTPGSKGGTTVNQLTGGATPGSVPGSANSEEDSLVPSDTNTPLIARIPEETLRASIEAGNIDEGDENAE